MQIEYMYELDGPTAHLDPEATAQFRSLGYSYGVRVLLGVTPHPTYREMQEWLAEARIVHRWTSSKRNIFLDDTGAIAFRLRWGDQFTQPILIRREERRQNDETKTAKLPTATATI